MLMRIKEIVLACRLKGVSNDNMTDFLFGVRDG